MLNHLEVFWGEGGSDEIIKSSSSVSRRGPLCTIFGSEWASPATQAAGVSASRPLGFILKPRISAWLRQSSAIASALSKNAPSSERSTVASTGTNFVTGSGSNVPISCGRYKRSGSLPCHSTPTRRSYSGLPCFLLIPQAASMRNAMNASMKNACTEFPSSWTGRFTSAGAFENI